MNDVFSTIRSHKGKRFIYGTGDGADKLIDYLEKIGISIDGICVSDDFYKKKIFRGMEVYPIGELSQRNPDGLFLMAFGTKQYDGIYSLSDRINLIYPEMPVCGTSVFTKEKYVSDEEKIKKAFSLLADEKSRLVFQSILKFRLSGDIKLLKSCESSIEEGYELILTEDEETIFDCGAYRGDTAEEFFKYSSSIKDFYAAEPCPKSFEKLKEKFGKYNLHNCAIGKEHGFVDFTFSRGRGSTTYISGTEKTGKTKTVCLETVDGILGGNPCTVIKYDVEGSEADALLGSERTIKKFAPNLLVAAYHKAEDLYEIPLLIDSLSKGYKIYLRHHPCLPSWETNVYAVSQKGDNK